MLSSGASPGIKCAGANERKGFRGAHEGRADGIRWSRVGLRGPAHPVLPLPGRSRNRSGLFTNPAFLDFVSAPVDYLVRKGLKRGWATLFVLGSLALVFVLAVLALAPMVTEQARQPVAALPGFLESTQELAGNWRALWALRLISGQTRKNFGTRRGTTSRATRSRRP